MAGKSVDEIVVGGNGSVRFAPIGTEFPATPTADPVGFVDLGYTSEDGVKVTDAKTLEEIRVWQMFYVARRIVNTRDFMLAFVLRQWSRESFPLAFGGGEIVEQDDYEGIYRYAPPPPEEIDERAMILDWQDGNRDYRLCVPRGMVTENVETNILRTGPSDLPITFGVTGEEGIDPWFLLTNDPAFGVPA